MAKKSNTDIEYELLQLLADSKQFNSSTVSRQRELAMDYYHGEPYGNEVEGRSNIVTREVFDVIEWMLPEIMRVFAANDVVVEFSPQGPEDVQTAKLRTDYVNYVFMRRNDGFNILHDWFKDALMQKNGVVKWWWDDSFKTREEVYEGLTREQAIYIDENHMDCTLKRFEELVSEEDGLTILNTKAVFKRRTTRPQVRVEVIPPEEFLISREARCIDTAKYVGQRKRVTRSDMKAMGFTEKQLDMVSFGPHATLEDDPEYRARHKHDETEELTAKWSGDESTQEAWLYESYIESDVDGDGIAELIKCFSTENELIEWEPADEKPFATVTPVRLPHKHNGLSIYDIMHDIQEVKSGLVRSMIDSANFMNHGRWGIVDGQVNINDLINSRPGGVVRLRTPNAVVPLNANTLDQSTFPMMDYIDHMGENRSGMSKNSQGLDPNALRSNVTATTHNNVMNASMQKRDLLVRQWAEGGVKRLFKGIYGLILKHQSEPDQVRLNNEFVWVDPTQWSECHDVVINVGLGTGNKDQKLAHYTMLTQQIQMMMQINPMMFTPENAYNWMTEGFKLMEYKDPSAFVTNPADIPPPEPQGPSEDMQLKMAEMQQKGQVEMAKLQETTRHNMAQEELDQAEIVRKTAKDEEDSAIDRAELQLERTQGRPVDIG